MSEKGKKQNAKIQVGDVGITIEVIDKKPNSPSKPPRTSTAFLLLLLLIMAATMVCLMESAQWENQAEGSSSFVLPAIGSAECVPGISAGNWARVASLPGVRLRSSPGYSAKDDAVDTVCCLGYNRRLQVLSGPRIADGLCWWWVRDESSGKEGWVADHAQGGQRLLKP